MKTKEIILRIIILTSLILFALPAYAQDTDTDSDMPVAVGEILSVEKQVTIIRDDGEEELKAEAKLSVFAGDRIITGEDSKAEFSINQSLFKLGSSSERKGKDHKKKGKHG